MAQILISKVQVRRGQELQTGIPRLDPGEFGWAEDTEHLYIGKRISEGAVDDENTRVLTETDLTNIFSLIGGPGNLAGDSSYRYRSDTQYIQSTTTSIATKLDNWVSLTDYDTSLSPSFQQSEHLDITDTLTAAIQNLYFTAGYNQFSRADTRRRLIIPAGSYVVSSTIDLPPYTTLVGEGPGLTTITFDTTDINPGTPWMFRTVDASGRNFDDDAMDMSIQDGQNARGVRLEGMTLQFTATNILSNSVLVSLDQVIDAEIHNIEFGTKNLSTSTVHGGAIQLRSGEISSDLLDTAPAGNIRIEKCKFHNLGSAVTQAIGTINRFFINNNIFDRLQSGITMWTPGVNTPGPTNGVIDSNRFERISNQAIVLGTATTNVYAYPSYTISSNNTFKGVGNGVDNITNSAISEYSNVATNMPVITFHAAGNKSVNDVFARRDFANLILQTPDNDFYYNPYIQGPGLIESPSVYRRQLSATANDLVFFPLNGGEQKITLHYELWNSNTGYSRKGDLIINLIGVNPLGGAYTQYNDGDPIGTVSDYYNYSCVTTVPDATWNVDSGKAGTDNYVTLQIVGFDPADIDPAYNGPYYIDYQFDQLS
jgi:hypothetical protein